jgi:DNA-binding NtrC family response regulator
MLNVLLVEDDRMISSVLISYFNSVGIAVHHANNIAEAKVALTLPFDCIISDYLLEDGTVHDIHVPLTPLIVISGFRSTNDGTLSAFAWIEKPFDLGNLERLIRKVCNQTA